VLFVLPLLFISPSIQNTAQNFLPHPMAANSLTAVKPAPHVLSAGLTFWPAVRVCDGRARGRGLGAHPP
jgi:hypothetical protein